MFALPAPEDVLQALLEDLEEFRADLARETPAQAALVKSARVAASSYLVKYNSLSCNDVQRTRRASGNGALALQRRRRSSAGSISSPLLASDAIRDSYAGAISSARRVNATGLLVAASDEVAEIDWLQFAEVSAASVLHGSESQVMFFVLTDCNSF